VGISLVSFSGRGSTSFKISFKTSDKSIKPGDDVVLEDIVDSGCENGNVLRMSLTPSKIEVETDFNSVLNSFKTFERSIKPEGDFVVVELDTVVVTSARESIVERGDVGNSFTSFPSAIESAVNI